MAGVGTGAKVATVATDQHDMAINSARPYRPLAVLCAAKRTTRMGWFSTGSPPGAPSAAWWSIGARSTPVTCQQTECAIFGIFHSGPTQMLKIQRSARANNAAK